MGCGPAGGGTELETAADQVVSGVGWSALVGGFRDARRAAAFHAGRHRYWAAGGPPRCGAVRKDGGTCRATVRRAGMRCPAHMGPDAARVRLRRRLGKRATDLTPEQFHRLLVRVAANRLRVAWRRDPWTPGLTLLLMAR